MGEYGNRRRMIRFAVALLMSSLVWFSTGLGSSAVAATTMGSGRAGTLHGVSADLSTDVWAVGAAGNQTSLALQWQGASWLKATSPSPGSASALTGVAATSSSDAWAVGRYVDTTSGHNKTLAIHWNGAAWTAVSTPSPGSAATLEAISADSAADVWAVGQYVNAKTSITNTLVLHWNGSTWSKVASPNPGVGGNDLTGVSATSSTDVWAVGSDYKTPGSYRTLALHWGGSAWSQIPTPNVGPNTLSAVSGTSAKNVWAVGSYQNNATYRWETLILHWDGVTWTLVPSPDPGTRNNTLSGVSADSRTDAWSVGQYFDTTANTWDTLTLHWDGTSWSQMSSPSPGTGSATNNGSSLLGVSTLSSTDAWAVGYYYTTFHLTLVLHWDGLSWTEV